MPDVAAMQKMTPAQLEAYKQKLLKQYSQQAKTLSAGYNIKIDESALPDFTVQQPQKDIAKLSLLPKQPPTLIQLADGLRASKKTLESVTPKPVLQEVQKIATSQNPAFSAGIGIGANFNGLLKASASEMLYVSFDQNNQFSDFGTTGNVGASVGWQSESLIADGIGKLSGTVAGINGGYTLGVNSGFTASVKGKGVLDDFIKLEYKK